MRLLQQLVDHENTFLKVGMAIFAGAGITHWSSNLLVEARQDAAAFAIVSAILVFNIIAKRLETKKSKSR